MSNLLPYLVLIGAGVQFLGGLSYVKATARGETKPNRMSWLMWAIAPFIGTAAALSDGVTWAALPVFMVGFMPLFVLIASFKNKDAYWKLETFDYFCGACSVLALILWRVTHQPDIAIIFAILSDTFAAVPTLIKSWHHPDTESGEIYAAGLFGALTSFAAIHTWTFSSYAFPIYLVFINSSLTFAVYHRALGTKNR